jgi:hypothetical protein
MSGSPISALVKALQEHAAKHGDSELARLAAELDAAIDAADRDWNETTRVKLDEAAALARQHWDRTAVLQVELPA